MAKYCANCGKQLPDGVEICPDCNVGATEAALFTRLKIEPEVLMGVEETEDKKGRLREKLKELKWKILAYAGALVLLAVAVVVVLQTRPEARVIRALNGGDYEKAYQTYQLRLADKSPRDPAIDKAIVEAGERICRRFADHEISTQEAAEALNLLYGLGDGTQELLAPIRSQYDLLNSSMGFMEEADKLFEEGEYLAAHEAYVRVLENDSGYEQAVLRAQECFDLYAGEVIDNARLIAAQHDYPGALKCLADGDAALLDYDTFSPALDEEVQRLRGEYEAYALSEAGSFAGFEDYQSAIDVIADCARVLETQSEAMTAAVEGYEVLLREKKIKDASQMAEELYAADSFAQAFGCYDELISQVGDDDGVISRLVKELQSRFEKDILLRAREAYGGDRSKLPDAIRVLSDALEVRELEAFSEYKAELEQYLPANLTEIQYMSKEGVIFRNSTVFEALDGNSYSQGWMWGENGASITFEADGKYDVLQGVFADRRDDSRNANAHYEVWCDGTMVYKSKTLFHYQKDSQTVEVDISGCKELTIVFKCDYEVNTSDKGYCYHGLCDMFMMKNLPEVRNG